MKRQKGFTLIELLIVVAIIGIIAAIAIPSLLRARISANEAGMIGDTRTVISAQVAYHAASGGFYGSITCLGTATQVGNAACIPGYPVTGPSFLDQTIIVVTTPKSGYARTFLPFTGSTPVPTVGSLHAFCYGGNPSTTQGGVRAFGGDGSGVVGQSSVSTSVCCDAATGTLNTVVCPELR